MSATLAELEAIIERGWETFVEVGNALTQIRDRKLYREACRLTATPAETEALQSLVPLRMTAVGIGAAVIRNGVPLPSCLVCAGRRAPGVRRRITRAGGRNVPGYEGPMPGMPFYYGTRPSLWVGLCDPCAADAELEHRHLERLERRQGALCLSCGEKFIPPRNDAAYCSSACRQKAYRRRGRVAA